MEVDNFKKILDSTVIQLAENRALVEELVHEGPIYFEDDSVTLHRASYHKGIVNILLQHAIIKGKKATKKWVS